MNVDHERRRFDALPPVERAVHLAHVTAFAQAFVIGRKRDRWLHLLGTGAGEDSHKLREDLDTRKCRQIDSADEVRSAKAVGVYHNFDDEAKWVDVPTAFTFTPRDAILSLIPGKLALYFFHEGEFWLCEAK